MANDPPLLEQLHCDVGTDFVKAGWSWGIVSAIDWQGQTQNEPYFVVAICVSNPYHATRLLTARRQRLSRPSKRVRTCVSLLITVQRRF